MVSPEILRRYSYFAGVSEQSLKQIAMISEEKTARTGDVLFREGEDSNHMYIIVDGEVDVRYELGSGEHRTVDTLVAGEFMVWSAVIEPHRTHSTGVATKNVRMIAIDAPKLRKLCEDDPVLGFKFMRAVAYTIAHRLNGARLQIAAM